MTGGTWILIVHADRAAARALRGLAIGHGEARVATTARAASRVVREQSFAGILLDMDLPDDSGLDWLASLRRRMATIPVLCLAATHDPNDLNRAHALRAECVVKPPPEKNLRAFLQYVSWYHEVSHRQLATLLAALDREEAFTRRERQILAHALKGKGRKEIAATFGLAESTVKSQIRLLLSKTGHRSLAALKEVLWSSLLSIPDGSVAPRPSPPGPSERAIAGANPAMTRARRDTEDEESEEVLS